MGGIETVRTVKPALKVCSPWVNVPLLSARCEPSGLQLAGGTGGLRSLAGEQAMERASTAGNGNDAESMLRLLALNSA